METAYHLHYILTRRYGDQNIKVHFIDLLEHPPEGELGKVIARIKEEGFDEPVILLENDVIAEGYIHPWTLFELIESRGLQANGGV